MITTTRNAIALPPRIAGACGRRAALAAMFALCAAAGAQTITVNTTGDFVDFGGAQMVADLPGPDGLVSFREACAAANNTPGPQTIEFAIPSTPPNEWNGGVATIASSNSFSLNDDETTVDFSTQQAFTGNTNPNGNEVGFRCAPITGAAAIYVNGDNCVVRGLDRVAYFGYGVALRGNNNRVVGCTISGPLYAGVYINGQFNGPAATGNTVGGISPADANTLTAGNSGVRIDGPAENNVVIGNTLRGPFFGVEIRTATCCPGNVAANNRIGGPTPAERNIIAGAGKYGEEGFPDGGQVTVQYSTGNIIEGNHVGVLADGVTIPSPQRGPVGVEVRSSPGTIVRDNLIGGILVVGANHYAGQRFGDAIRIMGDCRGSIIQGNRIGVDPSGTTPLPCRRGVSATYWSVNGQPVVAGPSLLGGDAPGEGNIIANCETEGVRMEYRITGLTISGNSIFNNSGLGIDLLAFGSGGVGVTPNDPGDPDTGANNLQNFPVLDTAVSVSDATTVSGSLNSLPNQAFSIEFFANDAADPSGFGEGQEFLGAAAVTTDAAGDANFEATLTPSVSAGRFITATATRLATGDTSEFSATIVVEAGVASCPGDANGDNIVNFADLNLVLANFGSTGSPGATPGDVTGDGVVNFADLNMTLSHFGMTC